MKNISILGRATRDCEVKSYQERSFASFSVAVDDGYGPDKGVIYFDVAYHRSKVAEFITKGTLVGVTGEFKVAHGKGEHAGRTYLKIQASTVSISGGGRPKDGGFDDGDQNGKDQSKSSNDMDDEIPF